MADELPQEQDQQNGDSSSSIALGGGASAAIVSTSTTGPIAPSTPLEAATVTSASSFTSLPIMREQDADLLESMHYAASEVARYSPGGTPVLRPNDRSLPMEDLQLTSTPVSSVGKLPMRRDLDNGCMLTENDSDIEENDDSNKNENERDHSPTKGPVRSFLRSSFGADEPPSDDVAGTSCHTGSVFFKSVTFSDRGNNDEDRGLTASISGLSLNAGGSGRGSGSANDAPNPPTIPDLMNSQPPTSSSTKQATEQQSMLKRPSFRRLLSGEVRTIGVSSFDEGVVPEKTNGDGSVKSNDGDQQQHNHHLHQEPHITMSGEEMVDGKPVAEDGETTTAASPLSVFHEAEKAKSEQELATAERRRVNEAMQFAQAVGEEISVNRNDLRIIEDNEEEDDDDDDDEAIEAKEVVAMPSSSLHQYDDRVMPHGGQEANTVTTTTAIATDTLSHTSADAIPFGTETLDATLPTTVDILPTQTPGRHRRHKSRPIWPFELPVDSEHAFLEHLSDGAEGRNFVYRGIQANPPEITKHGIQRGNYAQLHRKAWLEVSDKYHRYGKNLRLYYRYWERLGFPTNQFFDWLDSKGEAAGQALPNMDECPRSVLDSDTVLYITNPNVTDGYALDIVVSIDDGRGRVVDVDGDAVLSGPDGWIFVLRDNVMYGGPKITSITGHSKQRFHHSSFFGGKAVSSAGIIITDDNGYLVRLYPHSGHYRPSESHMQRMLLFLYRKGVDLRTFEVDTQQLSHLSREKDTKPKDKKPKDGKKEEGVSSKKEKAKKVDSLHLEKAIDVACYLAHKADFIGKGIFDMIHKIRKADVTSVTEALILVDDGGYWKRKIHENHDTGGAS